MISININIFWTTYPTTIYILSWIGMSYTFMPIICFNLRFNIYYNNILFNLFIKLLIIFNNTKLYCIYFLAISESLFAFFIKVSAKPFEINRSHSRHHSEPYGLLLTACLPEILVNIYTSLSTI